MQFRLLGPLEVTERDRSVVLGGAKQRALLAVLLLHANEVVSSERLIDDLWPDAPPRTAAKSIQVYVSALRKAIGDGRIVTRPPGYLLRVDPSELDVAGFERLVAEARTADPERAATLLRQALALWRGPPLADLAYEPFAQVAVARLDELRLTALEQRLDADLATGRHADLVGELEALVAEHPLRDRPRRQLMLALYRSGRQAEALEVYRHARRALVEELGIEPSAELRGLEQAILVQDPSLDAPAPSDPEPPAPPSPGRPEPTARGVYVGRERELAQLVAALEDTLDGRERLVLVAGEPGAGKSRLADELAERARARGARVLVGRCWEAGGAPAYWPWTQALRAYVRDTEPEALRAQLGAGAVDLAPLLPELGELFPGLAEPPAVESDGTRFRLFEAATSFLRSAARDRPLVLVLDDLHAADEPSLLLLRFVARELAAGRLLVVCAFRDVDPTPRGPLASALAELVREQNVSQITLAGLSKADVAQYIELASGTGPLRELAPAIYAETEGNPLFVVEVVRLLEAERRSAEAETEARPHIPPGIRAVIGQRVGRLSQQCQGVLVAASVMGREFRLDALGRVSGLGGDALLDVLDEAMVERVVGDVPGSPGRLRFGHTLIRETLYAELTPARRLQRHNDVAGALEAVYAADLEPHLSELAHHFFAAAPAGGADKAVDYALRAGNRAASQLAYEEAVRLYEIALTLVGESAARCELLLARGDVEARAGDTLAARRSFREAAELAEGLGLREQLARAAVGYGGRIIWDTSSDDEHLVPLLERALAALGDDDSPLRVRLLVRLAGGPLRAAGHPPERKAALSDEALETARRLGDHPSLAYALAGWILDHNSPRHTRGRLTLASELVHVAAEVGDKERAMDGHENRFNSLLELGDASAAKLELEAMARLARELRQPSQEWLVCAERGLLALLEGRLADAERMIADAWSLGERPLGWSADVTHRIQLYPLRRAQGRLGEVEDLVRRSVGQQPIWRCVLAHMAAELGRPAEARESFEALAREDFAGLPFDEEWLVSLGFLAETARELGDVTRASVLYGLLAPYGDRLAVSYTEISTGAVARYLGLLAGIMERWDDAERHFEDALELHRRIGAQPYIAHTQEDHARMLRARDAPGDRQRAGELLEGAVARYRGLGMERWAERAASDRAG